MIRILLIDDHQIFLDGLCSILEIEPDFEVVGTALNGAQGVIEYGHLKPDLVCLDISMPIMDGRQAAQKIFEMNSNAKILIVSYQNSQHVIMELIQTGVQGYLLKNQGGRDLIRAIRSIIAGKTYYSEEVKEAVFNFHSQAHTKAKLSAREKEVLEHIANGKTAKEIGEMLFIARTTVETHRRNMLQKLGCSNSIELIRYAMDNGLVK